MSLVSFVRAQAPDYVSIRNAIEKSLNLISFNLEKDHKKILIKPNLCYYHDYSTGETTDPRFVGVLIDVLRKRLSQDPNIFVIESDASAMKCKHVFRMLGYEKMTKEKDVKLVNLSEEKNDEIEMKINDQHFRFRLPQIISETGLLVNVPKIKYQSGVKITCALKNIYGCNAYPKKYVYHKALNEVIVGINKRIKSDLVVVDGIVVAGTTTKRLGLVMASKDPVAIDAAASKILGFNPKSVEHIELASGEGIGNMDLTEIGESLAYIKSLFPRRRMRHKIRGFLASVYLHHFK